MERNRETINMSHIKHFKIKLLKILKPNKLDIDVGIYKIINWKSDVIDNFINNKLENIILDIIQEFKDIKSKDLSDIFNHLCIFFSKYYKDGNFESKFDISSENNKQVKLCWINQDQYYVKSDKIGRKFIDFFIHKNLGKFLNQELNYYIKLKILNDINKLDEITITKSKVIFNIGTRIIDLLSEIENLQKKLWGKKKFVIKTEYVITSDKLPECLYEEVLNNEKQKQEWINLKIIKNINEIENLKVQKLPVDTRYFNKRFKEILLTELSQKYNIDDYLDGILIKSENWQALNLLLEKYEEKIQTIYIDPPFNLNSSRQFMYKTNYKDSVWATLLENRLRIAKDWLNEEGSIFVRCDYNGNWIVRCLMDEIFGKENFRNEIILQRSMQTRKSEKRMLNKTESLFFYFKNLEKGYLNILEREKKHVKCFNETLKAIKKLDISLHVFEEIKNKLNELFWIPFLSMPGEQKSERSFREIFGIKLYPKKGRHWAFAQKNLNLAIKNGIARLICKNCGNIITNESYIKNGKCKKCNGERLEGQIYSLYNQINDNWTDISGYEQDFNFHTKNSEILLKRVIESTSNEGDLVLDFFLGSGTTTAVAHKLGRKWIGIEMGDQFELVTLPRMKKVITYDKSGISKEKDVKEKYNQNTASGFFKYQYLEQYEDTLHNEWNFTEFKISEIKTPFDYKIKVISNNKDRKEEEVTVDLVETFNYLIGLKVNKIKYAYNQEDNNRKYIFIEGEIDNDKIAVVWRDITNLNNKTDKEFIEENLINTKNYKSLKISQCS